MKINFVNDGVKSKLIISSNGHVLEMHMLDNDCRLFYDRRQQHLSATLEHIEDQLSTKDWRIHVPYPVASYNCIVDCDNKLKNYSVSMTLGWQHLSVTSFKGNEPTTILSEDEYLAAKDKDAWLRSTMTKMLNETKRTRSGFTFTESTDLSYFLEA